MFLHLYVSFKEFKDKFWFLSTFKDINIFERNLRTSRRPGPHIDASLFSWQRAVALLLRSCRCFSNLVIWCLSSSFVVFQAFSLNHLYPSVQLVLTVCCRPFAERARAISVFSLSWWDLSSAVVSAPWPSCYWLCLFLRYPSFLFGTCGVRLLASSFVQLLVAITVLHRTTLWTSLTTQTISLWVWCWCLFFRTDFSLPNMLLALPILVWESKKRNIWLNVRK